METLLKIIKEKMMLIEELKQQLADKTEEANRWRDSSMFWYDNFNELKKSHEKIR